MFSKESKEMLFVTANKHRSKFFYALAKEEYDRVIYQFAKATAKAAIGENDASVTDLKEVNKAMASVIRTEITSITDEKIKKLFTSIEYSFYEKQMPTTDLESITIEIGKQVSKEAFLRYDKAKDSVEEAAGSKEQLDNLEEINSSVKSMFSDVSFREADDGHTKIYDVFTMTLGDEMETDVAGSEPSFIEDVAESVKADIKQLTLSAVIARHNIAGSAVQTISESDVFSKAIEIIADNVNVDENTPQIAADKPQSIGVANKVYGADSVGFSAGYSVEELRKANLAEQIVSKYAPSDASTILDVAQGIEDDVKKLVKNVKYGVLDQPCIDYVERSVKNAAQKGVEFYDDEKKAKVAESAEKIIGKVKAAFEESKELEKRYKVLGLNSQRQIMKNELVPLHVAMISAISEKDVTDGYIFESDFNTTALYKLIGDLNKSTLGMREHRDNPGDAYFNAKSDREKAIKGIAAHTPGMDRMILAIESLGNEYFKLFMNENFKKSVVDYLQSHTSKIGTSKEDRVKSIREEFSSKFGAVSEADEAVIKRSVYSENVLKQLSLVEKCFQMNVNKAVPEGSDGAVNIDYNGLKTKAIAQDVVLRTMNVLGMVDLAELDINDAFSSTETMAGA